MMARLSVVAAIMLVCTHRAGAQQGSLTGSVVARATGEPLAYSIVGLPALGRERFASDSGVFHFGELPAGLLGLRIRRLGYAPVDTSVTIGAGQSDTVRIELSRVAMKLGSITVSAPPPCLKPGPPGQGDSALTVILNQIKLNAEQYRFLSEQYPFYYMVEIMRSSRLKVDGQTRIDSHQMQRIDARSDWNYKPGKVLARRGNASVFHIPTLVDFADRDFLAHHCFHFGGTETVKQEELLRVHVVASERIKDPDVNGTIFIDPQTFQVRQTVLRLSRFTRETRFLTDFEVTTEFREIMPSIPIIASVSSVEKLDPDAKLAFDIAWETQKLSRYEFLRGKPGDDARKRR